MLRALQVDTTTLGCTPEEAEEKPFIASMGIYVFKRKALLSMLDNNPEDMDFGAQVIPRAQQDGAARRAPPPPPPCMRARSSACPRIVRVVAIHVRHAYTGRTLQASASRRTSSTATGRTSGR